MTRPAREEPTMTNDHIKALKNFASAYTAESVNGQAFRAAIALMEREAAQGEEARESAARCMRGLGYRWNDTLRGWIPADEQPALAPPVSAAPAGGLPPHLPGWNYWRDPDSGKVTILLPQDDLHAYARAAQAAPSPQQSGEAEEVEVVRNPRDAILRDLCELDPADPDNPDTVAVNLTDLMRILRRYVPAPTQPAAGDDWLPIESAPKDERIVMAYFGPDKSFYGFARVGNFFQWECMPTPLPTGWPSRTMPTHWRPLPSPPDTARQGAARGE